MRFLVFILSCAFVFASFSQLVKNSKNGLYEHVIDNYDSLHLLKRFQELRLDINNNLQFEGSFSHMVKQFAPVEIRYIGKAESENYILTKFQLKGGISNAWLKLEEVPNKQKRKWIEIIENEIQKMGLRN
ncbi:hypothetical protein [Ekhidna sp.]|uniref:hypothetical protein n=1 Tax=Ekhidna sp. TaxID=2608089 RepID=UPI003BAABF77